jgi:hypothetical protein
VIVIATVSVGSVAFIVADPPTAQDLDRWHALASMPGLAEATWEGRPGDSVVPARQAPKA